VTTYLYEKDLVPQKYRILVAYRHDMLVRKIAEELDIPVQELRRYLIENLPARAEMADAHADQDDPVARELGREKYTLYLRIMSGAAMDAIFHAVSDRVRTGAALESAITYGRAQIREELRR
jgi:hypothetical protein